jgi:hypothetical protein
MKTAKSAMRACGNAAARGGQLGKSKTEKTKQERTTMNNGCEGATFTDNIVEDSEIKAVAEQTQREVWAAMKKLEDAVVKKYGETMKDFFVAVDAENSIGRNKVFVRANPKKSTADFGGALILDF